MLECQSNYDEPDQGEQVPKFKFRFPINTQDALERERAEEAENGPADEAESPQKQE